MNSNEIEEKLEKDSITIKEQILNLQNTIKKLKTDMIGSNQMNQIPKQSDAKKEAKREEQCLIRDNYESYNNGTCNGRNDINYDERENESEKDHHLKFSFNQNAQMSNRKNSNNNQLQGNNSSKVITHVNDDLGNESNVIINKANNSAKIFNSNNVIEKKYLNRDCYNNEDNANDNDEQENKYDYSSQKNYYQENISKIRHENNLLHQMEKVKEEINPSIERQLYKNTMNINNKHESEEDSESDSDNTFDKLFMQNKNTKLIDDKYKNMDLHDLKANDKINRMSIANKIRQEEDYNAKCNIGSAKKNNNTAKAIKDLRDSDIEDQDSGNELQLEDLIKEPKKGLFQEQNKYMNDSFLLDDAIKKLQKKGFTCIKSNPELRIPITKPNSSTKKKTSNPKPQKSIQDKKQLHLQSLRTNNSQRPKSTQKLVHQKNKSTTNIVIPNNKTNNTTLATNTPNTTNTNININTNTTNGIIAPSQLKEIKSYQNEISNLKNTIMKLKTENEKLKSNLQRERTQNSKYKELTEEIIKHYEKTKRLMINN